MVKTFRRAAGTIDTLPVITARNNKGLGVNFRIHLRTSTPMVFRKKKWKRKSTFMLPFLDAEILSVAVYFSL